MSTAVQTNVTGPFLFAVLLGCKPKGRNVEQHDVLFAVAGKLSELTGTIKNFWYKTIMEELSHTMKRDLPGTDISVLDGLAKTLKRRDKVHIDAWMKVEYADGYKVMLRKKSSVMAGNNQKLYFINLGGYRSNEFDEFHKKFFVVASEAGEAIEKVMNHDFMKEYASGNLGIAGRAHVDDQYKIDFEADDIVCISDTVSGEYLIVLERVNECPENEMRVGYMPIDYKE